VASESVDGEEVGSADADISPSEPELDPKVVSRRDALKKAAIGAGIAGAVWSAPRIEGLSLVPDYAAAGTIPGGSTIQIKATSAACSPLSTTNCWGNCVPSPGGTDASCAPFRFTVPAYAPAGPSTGTTDATGGVPSAYSSTVSLTNMAPPAPNQNEFFDVVWSGNADEGSTGKAALMFSLDPPFNMCAVTSVVGQIYPDATRTNRAAWPTGQLNFANHNSTSPSPAGPITQTTGADATFIPNPTPGGTAQGADITITITCT
jgi:hypothetical protein